MIFAACSAALALAAPAFATIYTTSPVASTHAYGGEVLEIKWEDNGEAPTLPEIGPCAIDLCIGSESDQRCIQNLGESVDVSKTASLTATIDAHAGENGKYYFIRYRSLNLVDPTSAPAGEEGSWPYQQYSARFHLNSMAGAFDAENKTLATESTGDTIWGASSAAAGAEGTGSGAAGASATGASEGAVGAGIESGAAASGAAATGAEASGAGASATPEASGARAAPLSSSTTSTRASTTAAARTSASAAPSEAADSGAAALAPGLLALAAAFAAYAAL